MSNKQQREVLQNTIFTLLNLNNYYDGNSKDFEALIFESININKYGKVKLSSEIAQKVIDLLFKINEKFENILKNTKTKSETQDNSSLNNHEESESNYNVNDQFYKYKNINKNPVFFDQISRKYINFNVTINDLENDLLEIIESKNNRLCKQFQIEYFIGKEDNLIRFKYSINIEQKGKTKMQFLKSDSQNFIFDFHVSLFRLKAILEDNYNDRFKRNLLKDSELINLKNRFLDPLDKINMFVYWKQIILYCLDKLKYDKSELIKITSLLQKIKELDCNILQIDLINETYNYDKKFKEMLDQLIVDKSYKSNGNSKMNQSGKYSRYKEDQKESVL